MGAELPAPEVSVVVPVRDGATYLARSLPALQASDLPRNAWELIVVDDASHDQSAAVAAQHADRVVRSALPEGPPAARNRGASLARGRILVFVDADVCVHSDALRRMITALASHAGLTAVFGAYDLFPAAQGLVSQYRNLLHAYVHMRDAGEAVTFWTGLGAVRREAFERIGGFDESERLDDVEFGYRLSAAGCRIRLDPGIQGTHLKRWTLGTLVVTDVRDRGVPWVRLLFTHGLAGPRATLNVRGGERVLTALTGGGALAATVGVANGDPTCLWLSGGAVTTAMLGDWRFISWLARTRGWWFALRTIPLRVLYYGLNVVSIGLALLPFRWRRRPPEPAFDELVGRRA